MVARRTPQRTYGRARPARPLASRIHKSMEQEQEQEQPPLLLTLLLLPTQPWLLAAQLIAPAPPMSARPPADPEKVLCGECKHRSLNIRYYYGS